MQQHELLGTDGIAFCRHLEELHVGVEEGEDPQGGDELARPRGQVGVDLCIWVFFTDPGVEDAQGTDHPGEVVDGVVGVLGHETFREGGTDLLADRLEMVLVELRAGGPGIADVTEQVDLVRFVED